ncbi:MAG: FAD:protein FMN transferase [bacterium]
MLNCLYCLIIGIIFITGCQKELIVRTNSLMDTLVEIKVVDQDRKKADEAIKAAFSEMKRIETLLGKGPESEPSRLGETPQEISPELMEVLKTSIKYSELTNGLFDVTIDPVTELWDFKQAPPYKLPPKDRLKSALSLVDYKRVAIERRAAGDEGWQCALEPGMKLDLGGVAKGYAVDRAIDVLVKKGITHGLVNAGGDIRTIGRNHKGKPWRIGVQHPREDKILTVVELKDSSVATSGDYERFFIKDGARYHHIIDPRAGYPAGECISVTITAPTCIEADVAATAVFIAGPIEGMKLIEQLEGIEGIIVTPAGKVITSSRMTNN